MRDQLDHLPLAKQRELSDVVRILFEEFEAATRPGTQRVTKQARIFKIVLYGSYARGDWVDDPIGGYQSDYDILIVVNDERLTDFDYWSSAEDRLMRETTIAKSLSAPVHFVVHSLTDVNNQIIRGRPFFVDVLKQGVALYETEGHPFAMPGMLPAKEARDEAQMHFDRWSASAARRLDLARIALGKDYLKEAAFDLHQSSEQLYHCTLLTFCLYSPKSHKLSFLRSRAEEVAPALIAAWPRDDRFARRCFELLRQAYVNARYSPHYAITEDQVRWIGERVTVLQSLVETVCRARLDAPLDDAGPAEPDAPSE